MFFWLTILLTIFANATYVICTKNAPPINPLASLTVTYAIALFSCLILYPFLSKNPNLLQEIRSCNWTTIVLGFTVVLLETGFIFAYRAGWSVAHAGIFSNVVVAIIMIPVAVLVYHDPVSKIKLLGVVIAAVGLILIGL